MKKIYKIYLWLLIFISFSACSNNNDIQTDNEDNINVPEENKKNLIFY